jgi:outer membrane protein TolC
MHCNTHRALGDNTFCQPVSSLGVKLEITQEIFTGGKRRLDVAIAAQGADEASLALLVRKFDVLTRIRRAYYEYLGGLQTVQVNEETVASLEQGLLVTRKQVEEAETRPRTDLLRIEALLEEARVIGRPLLFFN